jgi:restriction system protein
MNRVKYLLSYRYAEIIHDLTIAFTKKYILSDLSNLRGLGHLPLRKPDYRQADQMNQAARSRKQNIVEGVGQSRTSKKGEIKLLGVAKASLEELLMDCEDFLRQNNFKIYPLTDPRTTEFRRLGFKLSDLSNLSDLGHLKERPVLPANPEEAATFLLDRQIKALEEKFLKEGGFTENLFKRRSALKNPN